jgi:hypothetical protein
LSQDGASLARATMVRDVIDWVATKPARNKLSSCRLLYVSSLVLRRLRQILKTSSLAVSSRIDDHAAAIAIASLRELDYSTPRRRFC